MDALLASLGEAVKLIFTLDSEVIRITLLSLKVSGLAILLSTLVAVPFAYLLSNNKFRGRRAIINLVHTFMGLPPVVVGLVVYLALSRNGFLGGLDLLYSPGAMIIAQFIMAGPIITGVSLAALNNLDKQVKESIITLGATRWQKVKAFIYESRRGIITAVITGFGAAISEVGAIIIVGGNIRYHTRALTTAIVLETRRGNFELAMALGIILIAMAFLINYALTSTQEKVEQR